MSITTIRTIQPSEKKAIIASFEKIIKAHSLPKVRAVVNNYLKTNKEREQKRARIAQLQKEIEALSKK